MKELKVGDKVKMRDNSYCFGINNGAYTEYVNAYCSERETLTVIKTDLNVMREARCGDRHGTYTRVCDILVINNNGGFWFTQSRFVEPVGHTITIDGKDVTISDESYQELRKRLC